MKLDLLHLGIIAAFASADFHATTSPFSLQVPAPNYIAMRGVAQRKGRADVNWLDAGDFLLYRVDIPVTGVYQMHLHTSSPQGQGGVQITNYETNEFYAEWNHWPVTQSWDSFQTSNTTLLLPEGSHTIEFRVIKPGWSLLWWKLNETEMLSSPVTSHPPLVPTLRKPFELDSINVMILATSYSSMKGIAIQEQSREGTPSISFIESGDCVAYQVTLPYAGSYEMRMRVASQLGDGSFRIVNMVTQEIYGTAPILPITGGGQRWVTVRVLLDRVPMGTILLQILSVSGSWSLAWLSLEIINETLELDATEANEVEKEKTKPKTDSSGKAPGEERPKRKSSGKGLVKSSSNAKSGTTPAQSPATPSKRPVTVPSAQPVASLTKKRVAEPTKKPIAAPTEKYAPAPTKKPVATPTKKPVAAPTKKYAPAPTKRPVAVLTKKPVAAPTKRPAPTKKPIAAPTKKPAPAPTKKPVAAPTKKPIAAPTKNSAPAPTKNPVAAPTKTLVAEPTKNPVSTPTKKPVVEPTKNPVSSPTKNPAPEPTKKPVEAPTKKPVEAPTKKPVAEPTKDPAPAPSQPSLSQKPAATPMELTEQPTKSPTLLLTVQNEPRRKGGQRSPGIQVDFRN